MKKLSMTPVSEAIQKVVQAFENQIQTEIIPTSSGFGRVIQNDIQVKHDIPPYRKSTVDGYAVIYDDVKDASLETPVKLQLAGIVEMGKHYNSNLMKGQTIYVPTGGMIPSGANAMIMIEDSVRKDDVVSLSRCPRIDDNMIQKGGDFKTGTLGLLKGEKMGASQVSVLASLGYDKVEVLKRPQVAILSTGDELVQPGLEIQDGQIYDSNSFGLSALCSSYGLDVVWRTTVKDDKEAFRKAINTAHEKADVILLSGGSSVGEHDYTLEMVAQLPESQILVHGLAFKPGKPTVIAKAEEKLVIGLPGHPVSALMVMDTIGRVLLNSIWCVGIQSRPTTVGVLTDNIYAAKGRDSCQMVEVVKDQTGVKVIPVKGKSGMISWMAKAGGYVVIPHVTGMFEKNDSVKVYLWETLDSEEWLYGAHNPSSNDYTKLADTSIKI